METELKSLEEKITQFVKLCQCQQSENIQLRQQLAVVISENTRLSGKIDAAINRLEILLTEIPRNET